MGGWIRARREWSWGCVSSFLALSIAPAVTALFVASHAYSFGLRSVHPLAFLLLFVLILAMFVWQTVRAEEEARWASGGIAVVAGALLGWPILVCVLGCMTLDWLVNGSGIETLSTLGGRSVLAFGTAVIWFILGSAIISESSSILPSLFRWAFAWGAWSAIVPFFSRPRSPADRTTFLGIATALGCALLLITRQPIVLAALVVTLAALAWSYTSDRVYSRFGILLSLIFPIFSTVLILFFT